MLFLFYTQIFYGQYTKSNHEITIFKGFKENQIENNFNFYIDYNKTTTIKDAVKIDFSKTFNNTFFNSNTDFSTIDYVLWLQSTIYNSTNDTLNLVASINNFRDTKIIIKSKNTTEFKNIGYLISSKKFDFQDDSSSFKLQLLPFQKKQITICTYVDYLSKSGIEVKLQTNERYIDSELDFINKYSYLYAIFTLLTGGILILLFYNVLLFFQYRENNYLFYSLHLLFTFFNYSIVADGINHDFYGVLNQYRDLMLESSYVLSFTFYSIFVFSVLSENTKKITKKLFVFYISFMLFYLLSVHVVFQTHNNTIISNFSYAAFAFRIVSCFFGIYIMYILLKTHKNSYLKYIMFGTLVLVISYFIHVICNLIFGNTILNHYFNLIGSLIEILFFTYALNLRKKLAEQERDILIKMNRIKSHFFANISHEFRTPLTLIKSPVQSLQGEIKDENQKIKLDLIDKNSNRMLELVDQLLELSKIDSGKLQLLLKEGNIFSFLVSIAEPFQFKASESNLNFKSNIEKISENHYFDKDVVEKIVSNLLSNALKYTAENETINFSSTIFNNELKMVVSNSGSNIKTEDLTKLFERFYQNNENKQGVGIGLALVKELVELYQGKIETNVENGNLSFSIVLPLESSNSNAVIVTKEKQANSPENNLDLGNELPILLLADDNAEIRSVLKDIFKQNYQILEADDGEKALKIAQTAIPDCIISDVMMPKMDGFEFTKAIKNSELTSFIPVILLTAKTSDEARLEGLKSTADVYLTKPFNNEIVKETVKQLINERKKLQERYSQELVLKPTDIVINSVDEKFIERLQKALDDNVSNSEYSSDDFAKDAQMSRMQLHRKLKTLFGVSATEFLRNERLKIAAELLKKGNGNISDVAYGVGFSDVSYFSKCFKEVYQCTPTEFIERK